MRIGLNLLPLIPGIGGGWNYVVELVTALADHDHDNEYVVFTTGAAVSFIPPVANFDVVQVPLEANIRALRVAFENTVLAGLVIRRRLDCVHHLFGVLPFGRVSPTVVTMLDLMVFTRPDDFGPAKRGYLQYMRHRAARGASVLAPMSRTTAEQLHEELGVAWDRMEIVLPAVGRAFVPQPAAAPAFRARYGLPAAFWLCVSRPYPHKNYDRLIPAFAAARRADPHGWPLVIRGERTRTLTALAESGGVADQVIFLPRLPQSEMPLLYSSASALVFPSLFEGGGLPMLEAMACACPVVASDIPTAREFGGDAPALFDPYDVAGITNAMLQCEQSTARRAVMASAGVRQARQLGPQQTADAAVRAYERAVQIGE